MVSDQILDQLDRNIINGFKTIKSLRMKSGFDRLRLTFIANGYFKKVQPDLVYTIMGPTYWEPKCIHLQGFALPLLVYERNYYKNPWVSNKFNFKEKLLNGLKGMLIKKSDYVIVETERMKSRFCQKYKFLDEKVFVVENSFSPMFKRSISSNKVNRSKKNSIVFVPTSYYEHKNLEIIPLIAKHLKNNNISVKFKFLLDPLSQSWEKLTRLAQLIGVEDYLETVGVLKHEQMALHYKLSDLVFLPTLIEASTAVYPESFAAKIPLITSDREFTKELCGTGATYCDPLNPEDSANKIIELLKNPKKQRKQTQNGIRQLIKKYSSPQKKWEKTLKIIDNLLENKNKRSLGKN